MTANSPFVVNLTKKFNPLPVGAYLGKYLGVENFDLKGEDKWRWKWEVVGGEHAGKLATAMTNQSIGHGHGGRIVTGLLGRELTHGENVKNALEACIGQTYMVTVAPGPKGGKPQVQFVSTPPQM